MEVSIETFVWQFDVKLLNYVLYNEELAILNRLLKRLLYVPEHQILKLSIFGENPLESVQIALLNAVNERAAASHELHEAGLVAFLHALDLVPKTPNAQQS